MSRSTVLLVAWSSSWSRPENLPRCSGFQFHDVVHESKGEIVSPPACDGTVNSTHLESPGTMPPKAKKTAKKGQHQSRRQPREHRPETRSRGIDDSLLYCRSRREARVPGNCSKHGPGDPPASSSIKPNSMSPGVIAAQLELPIGIVTNDLIFLIGVGLVTPAAEQSGGVCRRLEMNPRGFSREVFSDGQAEEIEPAEGSEINPVQGATARIEIPDRSRHSQGTGKSATEFSGSLRKCRP